MPLLTRCVLSGYLVATVNSSALAGVASWALSKTTGASARRLTINTEPITTNYEQSNFE